MIKLIKSPTKDCLLREADPGGGGWYGAKRGERKHKGLDVITEPLEEVYSPITGQFVRYGKPYSRTDKFDLIVIKNDVYQVKIMYVKPYSFAKGEEIKAGDPIGLAQDIAGFWKNGMANHVHLEVKKHGLITDPEPLLMAEFGEINP